MSFIARDYCYVCDTEIIYNALLAPIILIEGKQVPLCQECVEYANPRRVARGLTPIKVWPGTYSPFNDEIKIQFTARVGWPVIETPEKPRLVSGWREAPDIHRLFGEIYWAAELVAKEPEDTVNFTGEIEEK